MAAEWRTYPINVCVAFGFEGVQRSRFETYTGLVNDDYPGLAVTPRLTTEEGGNNPRPIGGLYAVTHVRSGYSVTGRRSQFSMQNAKALIADIARITDWTRDRADLEKDKRLASYIGGAIDGLYGIGGAA